MTNHSKLTCNIGFDGRTFLTEEEWRTYLRRKPVRYIRRATREFCEICGGGRDAENPFQHAHRIGFDIGVVRLALTPEFLDGEQNLVTAHRATCNKSAEFDLESSMRFLHKIGVRELPRFLPEETRALWLAVTGGEKDGY